MSTDVYFDLHSQECGAAYRAACMANNTNGNATPLYEAWWALLKAKGGERRAHYDPIRVAYLSNLVAECNYDLWYAFVAKWYWVLLTPDNIQDIVQDWRVLYDNAQKPENKEDCVIPDDMVSPEDVEQDLQGCVGFFFQTRVD